MSYLTLNGFAVPCDTKSSGEDEPEVIGEDVRAHDGTLLSTVHASKRSWTVTTPPISHATAASILAQTGNGVVCNGTFNNSVAVTCTVRSKGGRHPKSFNPATSLRVLTLSIREE